MRNVEIVKPSDFIPPVALPEALPEADRYKALKDRSRRMREKARKQALLDEAKADRQESRQWPLVDRDAGDSRPSFIALRRQGDRVMRDFWVVPEEQSYSQGCYAGARFADEYLRYMLDSPGVPLLGWIIGDMDFADASRKGTTVGFLARIEKFAIQGARA